MMRKTDKDKLLKDVMFRRKSYEILLTELNEFKRLVNIQEEYQNPIFKDSIVEDVSYFRFAHKYRKIARTIKTAIAYRVKNEKDFYVKTEQSTLFFKHLYKYLVNFNNLLKADDTYADGDVAGLKHFESSLRTLLNKCEAFDKDLEQKINAVIEKEKNETIFLN